MEGAKLIAITSPGRFGLRTPRESISRGRRKDSPHLTACELQEEPRCHTGGRPAPVSEPSSTASRLLSTEKLATALRAREYQIRHSLPPTDLESAEKLATALRAREYQIRHSLPPTDLESAEERRPLFDKAGTKSEATCEKWLRPPEWLEKMLPYKPGG